MISEAFRAFMSEGELEPKDEQDLILEMVKDDKIQKAKELKMRREATQMEEPQILAQGGKPATKLLT